MQPELNRWYSGRARETKLQKGKATATSEGIFTALVAVVGNVDRGGDVILPGAFTKTLQDRTDSETKIPVVYGHNWNDALQHIGAVTSAEETDEGLLVTASLDLLTPQGARTYRALQEKSLSEFSIGYVAKKFQFVKQGDQIVRELAELELLEVGPVVAGQNPDTELIDVKAMRLALAAELLPPPVDPLASEKAALVSVWAARLASAR